MHLLIMHPPNATKMQVTHTHEPEVVYHLSIYPKSGNPPKISAIIPSSSAFRLCAEFVAPVSGCGDGGATLRGGERAKDLAEDMELVVLGRDSKTENESKGCCFGEVNWGGAASILDSKIEKSASAQESVVDWEVAFTGVEGMGASDRKARGPTTLEDSVVWVSIGIGVGIAVTGVEGLEGAEGNEGIAVVEACVIWRSIGSCSGTADIHDEKSSTSSSRTFPLFDCDSITFCAMTGCTSTASAFREAPLAFLFTAFNRPGPMGPCSMLSGTKLLALKTADVGDITPLRRTIDEACVASGDWSRSGETLAVKGVDTGVYEALLRSACATVSILVDIIGLDTISPQSSSTSSSTGALLFPTFPGAIVSRLSSPAHGSEKLVGVLEMGGEIKVATAGVSSAAATIRPRIEGSAWDCAKSSDPARVSGARTFVTVGCAGAIGEDTERKPGLFCCQGSTTGELQSNAAGEFMDNGGGASLFGAMVLEADMDGLWWTCMLGGLDWVGAGVSQ
jgi:hypothetical protein